MKLIKKTAHAVIYSNVFVGVCAVALSLTNRLSVEGEIRMDSSLWFIFFSTIFIYSFLKFRNPGSSPAFTAHLRWAEEYPQLSRNIQLISLLASGCFFLWLDTSVKLIVLALAAVTAFYALVNVPFLQPKRKLRDFGLLKTFFVAIVWSIITVVVPLAGTPVESDMLVFLLLRRFLFILALTMVFEIKDLKSDENHQLQTLPMWLGVTNLKLLTQGVLLALMLILVLQYLFFSLSFSNMLAINLSLTVSVFCIQSVNEETHNLWYYFVLDGMMILQFVLVYVVVALFP